MTGRRSQPRRRARPGGQPSGGQRSGDQRSGPPRQRNASQRGSRGEQRGSRGEQKRHGAGVQDKPGNRRRNPDDLGGDHVEGRRAVRELLLVGRRRVHEIMIAEDIDRSAIIAEILDLAGESHVPVTRISRRRLESEARTEAPQGVMATAGSIRPVDIVDLVGSTRTGKPPFVIVLDGITDPGNLGAILRSAEVAGVTGVVLSRHRAVRLSPAAVKSAAGAIEHLDFALVGGIPTALTRLTELEVWTIGLDVSADGSVFELSAADGPVALVFGSEGDGLSRLVRERCDLIVSIPQAGALESLNVAAAAAVACFEVVRRRS